MERLEFSQEGSVVRISMKNFMTYKHETIYPGERRKSSFAEDNYTLWISSQSYLRETNLMLKGIQNILSLSYHSKVS